jgi:hypothetical protein
MKIASFLFFILLITFGAQTDYSQHKRIKIAPIATVSVKNRPNYDLHLKLAPHGKMFLSVTSTGSDAGELGASELGSLITDLPAGADKFNTPNKSFPKVEITVDPEITMLDLWNPITLFRRGSDVRLSLPNGLANEGKIEIAVPWDPPGPDVNVKPNPLFLIVTVADSGALLLNTEPVGTLANTKPLSDRVQDIFKEREANGVFREGSNEVEKSIMIVLPMSDRKVADLVTIARAIWLPGGDRISLSMDDPLGDSVDTRKSLLDLPPILPKKKP